MARDPLAEMVERIAELERRLSNVIRTVKVTENVGGGRVRVSDGAGFDPEPVRQASLSAGDWSFDAPAGAGAPGVVICPEGDPSQAFFLPCLPSADKPAASTDPGTLRLAGDGCEIVIAHGAISMLAGGKGVIISQGEVLTNVKTRLNNGTRAVSRKGDTDDKGHAMVAGADGVFA